MIRYFYKEKGSDTEKLALGHFLSPVKIDFNAERGMF